MDKLAIEIGGTFNSPFGKGSDLADLVELAIDASIALAGILALFIIISAGYKIMSSSGEGNVRGAASGKDALTWAIIGFIVVIASFTILQGLKAVLTL